MNRTAPENASVIRIVKWTPAQTVEAVESFLRRPAILPEAEAVAREVLADVQQRGDEAVAHWAAKFDGAALTPAAFAVQRTDIMAAYDRVDLEFKRAATETCKRVTQFARAGLRKDWSMATPKGGVVGEQFVPLARVGVYVPAGAAPLVSTALMTIPLARVAGVAEVVACTPADRNGEFSPHMLYALDLAGATEIYRIGGIQAIGAMAYGTERIRKVQKIVGPGGPYVTAAKRLVYGTVDLDMVAGPSEIAILADDTANPACIAADLLSQTEHGTGHERALLVATTQSLLEAVRRCALEQLAGLGRRAAVEKTLAAGWLLVQAENLDEGMDLINRFAPEHLELMVREPRNWIRAVRTAGAVFAGQWTPEPVGDFAAGPSHVLPTGGTAAVFAGLTADSFRRRMSYMSYTRADLLESLPVIRAFGRVEKLDAHVRSAEIRFE